MLNGVLAVRPSLSWHQVGERVVLEQTHPPSKPWTYQSNIAVRDFIGLCMILGG
jgi:hypothetical protein